MSQSESGPVRVLLVEDAVDQALLVRNFLQPATSFEITHSQDGFHAAELLREEQWDLLITDLNLPGTDGFELCKIARSVDPDLPILAITGYTNTQVLDEAFRAGATELQAKPLDRDRFVATVTALIGARGGAKVTILAIGGLVGDAEMGCGGTLLKRAGGGAKVVLVHLCRDEKDETGAGLVGARGAAEVLGAEVVLDESVLDDTGRRLSLLERLVKERRPHVAYFPVMDDGHPARREAFRVAKAATAPIPIHLGYQTATTGPDFRPTRFEDVSDQLPDKLEALSAYVEAGAVRPDLTPGMARAYARYWGRLERFGEVEPFEVLRDG